MRFWCLPRCQVVLMFGFEFTRLYKLYSESQPNLPTRLWTDNRVFELKIVLNWGKFFLVSIYIYIYTLVDYDDVNDRPRFIFYLKISCKKTETFRSLTLIHCVWNCKHNCLKYNEWCYILVQNVLSFHLFVPSNRAILFTVNQMAKIQTGHNMSKTYALCALNLNVASGLLNSYMNFHRD